MSEPKRYVCKVVNTCCDHMDACLHEKREGFVNGNEYEVEAPEGEFVRWEDYANLKAEVERLRASSFVTAVPVEQYERLREAGDAMADELIQEYGREVCLKFGWFKGWNAAKEGKPSETKSPSFIEDLGNGVEKHDLLFRYPAKEGKPSV